MEKSLMSVQYLTISEYQPPPPPFLATVVPERDYLYQQHNALCDKAQVVMEFFVV